MLAGHHSTADMITQLTGEPPQWCHLTLHPVTTRWQHTTVHLPPQHSHFAVQLQYANNHHVDSDGLETGISRVGVKGTFINSTFLLTIEYFMCLQLQGLTS